MKTFTITKFGRALVLAGVAAVSAVCWVGCGGDDNNPANNNGNNNGNNNNNNGGGTVPIEKWMKKNLDVLTDRSWCYDGSLDSCAKYGRLYTWWAAKTACQSVGMRLPTNAEWDALVTAAGGSSIAGKKLKSKSGWNRNDGDVNGNGTDDFGFSALPGGSRYYNGNFNGAGNEGGWWSATDTGNHAYRKYFMNRGDEVSTHSNINDTDMAISARCIKD